MASRITWASVGAGVLLLAAAAYLVLRRGGTPDAAARRESDAGTWRSSRIASAMQVTAPGMTDADVDESALLDRARRHGRAAEPEECLAVLDEYDRRFSSGALRPEAIVVRVDALLQMGKLDRAHTWAKRLNAGWPGSTHADMVREMIEEDRVHPRRIPEPEQ